MRICTVASVEPYVQPLKDLLSLRNVTEYTAVEYLDYGTQEQWTDDFNFLSLGGNGIPKCFSFAFQNWDQPLTHEPGSGLNQTDPNYLAGVSFLAVCRSF